MARICEPGTLIETTVDFYAAERLSTEGVVCLRPLSQADYYDPVPRDDRYIIPSGSRAIADPANLPRTEEHLLRIRFSESRRNPEISGRVGALFRGEFRILTPIELLAEAAVESDAH